MWHVDGHAKLSEYGIIIHGCIDGFSRYVVFMKASGNNKSVTVSRLMRDAFYTYGVPAHLRMDKGVENRKAAILMELLRGSEVKSAVIVGSSTSNQKIERQWKDVRYFVIQWYRGLFEQFRMFQFNNGMQLLDITISTHKYILQYLFLKRINESLQQWMEIWNRHKLSLPYGQQYMDPHTSKIKRTIVPKQLMDYAPINFGKYSTLYKLQSTYVQYCLFQHEDDEEDEDDNDEAFKLSIAQFELSEEQFIRLQQYEPLNLSNTAQECMERYYNCITDIYDL